MLPNMMHMPPVRKCQFCGCSVVYANTCVTCEVINDERDGAVQRGLMILDAKNKLVDMRDAAIEDLRQQLEEARAERDRYIARCVELEIRMEEIRRFVR